MRPKAGIAIGLIFSLVAGPVLAQTPQAGQGQPPTPAAPSQQSQQPQEPPASPQTQSLKAENLNRIRDAVTREPSLRIENGQLHIYVEVIANWPSFAAFTHGEDMMNGRTGKNANPMSHAEFVAMSTPQDLYSTAGIKPGEILTMAAVNVVGQWAITKALNKIATSRKEKQLRDIRAQIDAELAALKKDKEKN